MLSSSKEANDIARARELGIDDYLVKPVSYAHLLGMVKGRGRNLEARTGARLALGSDWRALVDEYKFLVHPGIAGHGPTLYQSGLPSTRRLELVSGKPLSSGAVAMHYRRAR